MVVDPTTGFVFRNYFDLGMTTREVLQYGPVEYADDIVFPTFTVRALYVKNVLDFVELFLITDAQFNLDLAADAFQVGSPGDVVIVDMTSVPEKGVLAKTVKQPVEDIAEFVQSGAFREAEAAPERERRPVAIVLAGFLLLGAIVVLWFLCWYYRFRHV